MCQPLGTSCVEPIGVMFSFTGFAVRGGVTNHHVDDFGVAFFEDKACCLFVGSQSAGTSPAAGLVKRYPIESEDVASRIRKATQGTVRLENCRPFMRRLWSRHWTFVHNGDLKNFPPFLSGVYQPVGDIDSELTFCFIIQTLRKHFPGSQPPLNELFYALSDITKEITCYGVFNSLLCNEQA